MQLLYTLATVADFFRAPVTEMLPPAALSRYPAVMEAQISTNVVIRTYPVPVQFSSVQFSPYPRYLLPSFFIIYLTYYSPLTEKWTSHEKFKQL